MIRKTLLVGTAFLIFACSNDKKEENKEEESTSVITKTVNNVSNLSKVEDAAKKMEELSAKLKNIKPLSNDELKAAIPETLNGLKRKSFSAGNYGITGMSTISAEYGDDMKQVTINIVDGAGESGSAVIGLMAMSLGMETESESNGTISKTTEINGQRSMTSDTKTEGSISSSIKFIHNDRYSVDLEGRGYSLEELTAIKDKYDLSALK